MSVLTLLYRFIVANALTVFYGFLMVVHIVWTRIKNPFVDPWAQRLRLEPPAPLTDPKYGVHKYIKVNNTKLHYLESGDTSKQLMIFVHGFPEFWYSWRKQITEFNKDYWCVAIDMRGYGDSEKPDGLAAYKIELLVEDIRDLVRNLGREKCVLVSHDWGGLVACAFRDRHPDALEALVVLASTSREAWTQQLWSDARQMVMSWYVFLYRIPDLPEKVLQMNNLEIFNKAMQVPGKQAVTEQDLECYKYWFGKPLALTFPVNFYRANFSLTLEEKKKCDKPVPFLYVLAKGDKYLSLGMIDKMKSHYASIDTHVLDNCGHFMQQEEPEKTNKLIRDFLKKYNV